MQKTPVKGTHTTARGLWPHRSKVEASTKGEVLENRKRLDVLLAATNEKTQQISAILREKAAEQARLKKDFQAAFKKTEGTAHQIALARTRTELEGHLHHTMRELDLKKNELKEICREVNSIKKHLR